MSNTDDMEIDIDSGRGLRGTKGKNVQQKARGNKSDHRGLEEKEREQRQREYIRKLQQETASNDVNEGEWAHVGVRSQGPRGTKELNSAQKASGNKDGKTVVRRARENNNSTSKHEKCNRQRIAMTKESGSEGMTTTVCQATKSKRV
jgi:hypothetical protein